jgi:hypothetical protein
VYFGWGNIQSQRRVIQRARTDPPYALLNRMQGRKQEMTLETQRVTAERSVPVAFDLPLTTIPTGHRFTNHGVDGGFFFNGRFRVR